MWVSADLIPSPFPRREAEKEQFEFSGSPLLKGEGLGERSQDAH
jgi:hypothetical protein